MTRNETAPKPLRDEGGTGIATYGPPDIEMILWQSYDRMRHFDGNIACAVATFGRKYASTESQKRRRCGNFNGYTEMQETLR